MFSEVSVSHSVHRGWVGQTPPPHAGPGGWAAPPHRQTGGGGGLPNPRWMQIPQ